MSTKFTILVLSKHCCVYVQLQDVYDQSSKFFSSIPDNAVPGSTEVPPRAEKEVSLRGPHASSAGSVLHSCTPPTAFHY